MDQINKVFFLLFFAWFYNYVIMDWKGRGKKVGIRNTIKYNGNFINILGVFLSSLKVIVKKKKDLCMCISEVII